MYQDNADKYESGKSGKENLGKLVEFLKSKKYIKKYQKDYKRGYQQYDDKQFHYQYLIEFENQECWILQSTTSVRSDRMNIHQWNSEHLKRLNTYIKKAYIVHPDDLPEKEKNALELYRNQIKSGKKYSSIDDILSISELYNYTEEYVKQLVENKGSFFAKSGNHFESWICTILNNEENFERWKNDNKILKGLDYQHYLQIMSSLELEKDEIHSVHATNKIPKLENGGKPKTDILLEVNTERGKVNYTFSCKKCSKDRVSVHEYTAKQFIEMLEIKDKELANAIYDFQREGCIKSMNKESVSILNERMKNYNDKLAKWVFSGCGEGIQCADYLITYKNEQGEFSIHKINDYISLLKKQNVKGTFGTFFLWTYPSGRRGERIQLKTKIL